jgi:hypothetical protein
MATMTQCLDRSGSDTSQAVERIELRHVQATMSDKKKRAERREQQSREVEASQEALRRSIAETDRLVDESEQMLRRHRAEREEDDDE